MYVDLWGWFQNYEWDALTRGDNQRRRLVSLARDGWRYRELADGEKAIQAFEEGAALPQLLNEGCWQTFSSILGGRDEILSPARLSRHAGLYCAAYHRSS